jgi:hypothetical protein
MHYPRCGGRADQIITWGGPIVTFRWDGADDVDIKNFSVREIDYSLKLVSSKQEGQLK